MKLNVSHQFLPKIQTSHAALVMDHFGIGFDTGRHVIADEWELPVEYPDRICFTGASGSGKSSLMRTVAAKLESVLDINSLELPEQILVDALDLPLQECMRLLSCCGLSEAQLLLRTPAELSDGQRYRFRLALALARKPRWILADEFTATLDRKLAKVIAHNIQRLSAREPVGFLLATTHEDILEDLKPTLHVTCQLDGRQLWQRYQGKKKESASTTNAGSVQAPEPTGRTSLGGITALTTSASPVL